VGEEMAGAVRLRFRPEQCDQPVPTQAGRGGPEQRQEGEPVMLPGTACYRGPPGFERHATEESERGMHGG
jgi:hypothetical protein